MNGLLRLALTPAVLAFFVEATTTLAASARAVVATTGRPTATATSLSGPLYTCNAERLSAMQQNGRALCNGRILEHKI